MNAGVLRLALAALGPACIGGFPVPAAVHVALCGGGTISLPLSAPQLPGEPGAPCCAKGCQGGSARKRFDRAQ